MSPESKLLQRSNDVHLFFLTAPSTPLPTLPIFGWVNLIASTETSMIPLLKLLLVLDQNGLDIPSEPMIFAKANKKRGLFSIGKTKS